MITVTRETTIAAAHRLFEYGGRCERLHGHNYRIHLTLVSEELDFLGMVVDFGIIKSVLFGALDAAWDHRTLLFVDDPLCAKLQAIEDDGSVCPVPFNPTAENMASYLGKVFFPAEMKKASLPACVSVASVTVYETERSWATWSAK